MRISLIVFLSLVLTLVLTSSPSHAQSVNPCDNPNSLPSSFFEIPYGPQGDWRATVSPDHQSDDPLLPVVVAGAGAMQGPAERRGMRLGCGVLKNRSEKQVVSVSLRWILVRNQDRALIFQNGYTADIVLVEGHTQPIELIIQKDSFRRTDFAIIDFATITAHLKKSGILSGDYFLYVGVYQVQFADGSIWTAEPAVKSPTPQNRSR